MIVANLAVKIAAAIFSIPPEAISPCLPMMPPLPTSPAEAFHREKVDNVLSSAWRTREGFDSPIEDVELVDEQSSRESTQRPPPSTYGEITSLGARQLFDLMGMTTTDLFQPNVNHSNVTFFDLGSGVGKLVVQAYLELPRARRVVGIEMAPTRHSAALRAWEGLVQSGNADKVRAATRGDNRARSSLELHQGDLFQLDISEATHVYVSSLCFTNDMIQKLADKLITEAPKLQCVATLMEFPPAMAKKFGDNPFMEFVEMSWTKKLGEGCAVYFYKARAPHDNVSL